MEEIKNEVVDGFKANYAHLAMIPGSLLEALQDVNLENKLGDFMVDKLAHDYNCTCPESPENLSELKYDILLRLTVAMARASEAKLVWQRLKLKTDLDPSQDQSCSYHDH